MKLPATRRIFIDLGSVFFLLLAYFGAYVLLTSQFSASTYSLNGQAGQSFVFPLETEKENVDIIVNTTLHRYFLYPKYLTFFVNDCLQQLIINGQEVQENVPFCDHTYGKTINLGPFLRPGANDLQFMIRNNALEGSLHVRPSLRDPVVWGIHLFFLGCIILLLRRIYKHCMPPIDPTLVSIFAFGTALRIMYMLGTPYTVRSYDTMGHVSYVWHVLQHASIPSPGQGWQMYQPPLYYFLSAFWVLPAKMLGATRTVLLDLLQVQAVLLSIVTLFLGMWMGRELFPLEKEKKMRTLFCLYVAVFPGLIFFASRISNDSLMTVVFFGFLLFLYRYWVRGALKDCYVSLAFLIAGLLTKGNALPLLAPAFVCYVLVERRKYIGAFALARSAMMMLLIIAAATSWYYFLRIFLQEQSHLIGNIESNNPALFTQDWTPWNLLVFRPFELLKFPFYSSWNDLYGRPYLWEVLLKSAFSGEWNFGDTINHVLRLIHMFNLVLLIVAVVGGAIYIKLFWKKYNPLWVTSAAMIGSMALLVSNKHNGGLQDFRYSTILVITVTFLLLSCIAKLPRRLRPFLLYMCYAHVFLITIYIYLISMTTA